MNEQQEFIERLKSIVKESQIHIPNYQGNENQLITEIRLSDFPDWLIGPTYDRFFTIFFRQGKPSHIQVEVVTGVDPLRLEFDPRNEQRKEGIPLGYIDRELFTDHDVTEDVYDMFDLFMPPGFKIYVEEFVVNLREVAELRFRLRLLGTKYLKEAEELFYILENLSRPEGHQDWYKESVEKEMQRYSTKVQSKDKTSK